MTSRIDQIKGKLRQSMGSVTGAEAGVAGSPS
jgi:uncharacterized protein YjbJ (UPF0337 family)